ncbi:MAG: HpcH/HpaI aldolase/citrate lyase family protein [Gemmataceae bacterium]
MNYLDLGASLYVPSLRQDLVAIGNGWKYPRLRSVIFCTEDAIRPDDVQEALANLQAALCCFENGPLLRFIRVRDVAVLRQCLGLDHIDRLTGFVLPKVTARNIDEYLKAVPEDAPFLLMPTLETREVFDPAAMTALRERLLGERWRILSLRIGGNDLLSTMGLRRPLGRTIYATPLVVTISQLVTIFRPYGFNLTAPVFDYLHGARVLARETRRDLTYGLFGKTAIHPAQVPLIESCYRVSVNELRMAERVLEECAPPVFRHEQAMCEPATHRGWAALLVERAKRYGVREQ